MELITEFSTFISLALHHAKLYDKIRRTENSVAVVQEVRYCPVMIILGCDWLIDDNTGL